MGFLRTASIVLEILLDRCVSMSPNTKGSKDEELNRLRDEREMYRSRYEHMMKHSPSAAYEVDFITGTFVRWNDEILDVLGYSWDEFVRMQPTDILTDDGKARFMKRIRKVVEGEEVPEHVDYDVIAKSGELIPVRLYPRYLFKDGVVNGATVIAKRRGKEEELKKRLIDSEKKYRNLVENAIEAIFVVQEGRFSFVNRRMCEILGYSEEELLGQNFLTFVHPDDRDMVMTNHIARLKGEGPEKTYRLRVITKKGEVGHAEIGGELIDWEGMPATLSFGLDVTERVEIEDELRRSEKKFRTVHDSSPIGIVLAETNGRILSVNGAFSRFMGMGAGDLSRAMVRSLDDPDDHAREVGLFREMMEGKRDSYEMEKRFVKKDGTERWARVVVTLVRGNTPGETFVIGMVLDTDDLIRAQEETREARRRVEFYLDLLGHDIGNIHQGLSS